jgi:hypothetical protein
VMTAPLAPLATLSAEDVASKSRMQAWASSMLMRQPCMDDTPKARRSSSPEAWCCLGKVWLESGVLDEILRAYFFNYGLRKSLTHDGECLEGGLKNKLRLLQCLDGFVTT